MVCFGFLGRLENPGLLTNELIKSTKYIGVLRKNFEKTLIEITQLNMEQKNKIWEYLTGFLNLKSTGKSVTLFS